MKNNKTFTYRDSKNVEHTISLQKDDFTLNQLDTKLHDTKFKSKPTTFFKDAFRRFAKNKSSVAGGIILGTIVLFSIFVPIFNDHSLDLTNPYLAQQTKLAPKLFDTGTGFWDGTTTFKDIAIDFDWEAYQNDGTYQGKPAQTDNSTLSLEAIVGDISFSKVGEKKLSNNVQGYARGGYMSLSNPANVKEDSYVRSPRTEFYLDYYDYTVSCEIADSSGFEDYPYGADANYMLALHYRPNTSSDEFKTLILDEHLSGADSYSYTLSDYPVLKEGLGVADNGTINGYFAVHLEADPSKAISVLIKNVTFEAKDGALNVTDREKERMELTSANDANLTLFRAKQTNGNEKYAYVSNANLTVFQADYVTGSFRYDTYMAAFGDYNKVGMTIDNLRTYESNGWMTFDYPINDFAASKMTTDDQARFSAGAKLTEEGIIHCPLRIDEENPLIVRVVGAGSLRAASFGGVVSRYREYGYSEMPTFLFGTDNMGRDMFKLVFNGLRFSILLGICTTAINIVIGLIWGAVSGYFGGWVDIVMERVCEILGGIPWVVVMTLILINKPDNFPTIIMVGIALCTTGWLGTAGLTRTQFYRFKDREYILAARTLGAKDGRLIFRHILPNAIGTLITSSVLMIPSVIFSEASLSYLKLVNGMQGFGSTLSENQAFMTTYPYLILFPSVVMALVMISFNLFGNGLRDAFNPSLKGGE